MTGRRIVIGVGNEYRHDDGFGPEVIAVLAARQNHDPALAEVELHVTDGEPTRMMEAWAGARLAIVVDVAVAADHAGGWCELTLPENTGAGHVTGHSIALGDTVALARALGRLPDRLVALVAYGDDFRYGVGLSTTVAAAVGPVADRARALLSAA